MADCWADDCWAAVAVGAVLRTEADGQFKELRKATDSEALVKEAKIEEMRARDKDAITAGFQAETDRLHAVCAPPHRQTARCGWALCVLRLISGGWQAWAAALQAENELNSAFVDAQDGAFTPMKRKVQQKGIAGCWC